MANGLTVYRFRYLWSDTEYVGVMAQDVQKIRPEAVVVEDNGFLSVRYDLIGFSMVRFDEWQVTPSHAPNFIAIEALAA